MRVAYFTTDEVNEDLAVQLAEDCGASLDSFTPKDAPPTAEYEAIVYDLDHLPRETDSDMVRDLLAKPQAFPAAVHSYRLEHKQALALRQHGFAVYSRLDSKVFRNLRSAITGIGA